MGLQGGIDGTYAAAALVVRPLLRVLTTRAWPTPERLPRGTGFVVVANHISWADPVTLVDYLLTSGVRPAFLAKSALFSVPVLGWVLRRTGQVPVLRGTADARTALAAGEQRVRDGGCVIMYTDGTITRDPLGWPMLGKTGAARIALSTGCPVVPVAQWGPQQLLPRHGLPRLWPRPRLQVAVGPPVDLSAWQGRVLDADVLRGATAAIVDAVVAELEALRGERAPGRWDPITSTRAPVAR